MRSLFALSKLGSLAVMAFSMDWLLAVVDTKNFFCMLMESRKLLLSEVRKVVKLILIMPASNATSERSFSALHRVKS